MHADRDMLFCVARLARALRFCRQESVFCEDLTFWQFFILETVGRHDRLPLSRLHAILAVEKSTTTRLVTPLVKRGLLARQRRSGDGRAVVLELTEAGRDVRRRIRQCAAGYFDAVVADIPERSRRQVFESLAIFAQALERNGPGCCSPIGGSVYEYDDTSESGENDVNRPHPTIFAGRRR